MQEESVRFCSVVSVLAAVTARLQVFPSGMVWSFLAKKILRVGLSVVTYKAGRYSSSD